MRRDDKDIRAIARDAVNLRHGACHVANVLNDMRHVDTLERIAVEGPGKFVEVPDDIGGRSRMDVDADGAGFGFLRTAANVKNRQSISYLP